MSAHRVRSSDSSETPSLVEDVSKHIDTGDRHLADLGDLAVGTRAHDLDEHCVVRADALHGFEEAVRVALVRLHHQEFHQVPGKRHPSCDEIARGCCGTQARRGLLRPGALPVIFYIIMLCSATPHRRCSARNEVIL